MFIGIMKFVWILFITAAYHASTLVVLAKLPGQRMVRGSCNTYGNTLNKYGAAISTNAVARQSDSFVPCGDELDQRIVKLALPAVVNFAIIPLVGAADTFWVGRMNNALALAGLGAANQVGGCRGGKEAKLLPEVNSFLYLLFQLSNMVFIGIFHWQVFSSAFWIISFLPSVITPQIAKAYGSKDYKEVRVLMNNE